MSPVQPLEKDKVGYSPLTATLAVLSGAREPNGVVGHFGRVGCLEEESIWAVEGSR